MKNLSTLELKKILLDYANEDLQILKENSCSAIADTKLGCLHNTYENGVFNIRYNVSPYPFSTTNESDLLDFFANSYQVELN
tara:strand:+ start:3516 stop:3761 length:246 start_codon:yes stop_codon:yes gene_type:complete